MSTGINPVRRSVCIYKVLGCICLPLIYLVVLTAMQPKLRSKRVGWPPWQTHGLNSIDQLWQFRHRKKLQEASIHSN